MTAIPREQNTLPIHKLADWLVVKSSQESTTSKIQYSLAGRVSLVAASLFLLVEAVARAVLSTIAFLGYCASLKRWQEAKILATEQIQSSSAAISLSGCCLRSIILPKELINHLSPTSPPSEPEILEDPIDRVPSPDLETLEPSADRTHSPEPKTSGLPTTETKPLLEPRMPTPPPPGIESLRLIRGTELIERKLQTQFERAQNQAAAERDKAFRYLSAPENFTGESSIEKVSENCDVGVCHFIGPRPTMEDEHLATSFELKIQDRVYPVQLFGVFDGHGGDAASRYVKENLEDKLHETLAALCPNDLTDEAVWNALKITFERLNEEFQEDDSGTTATIALILDGRIWTANVGDSRTILSNGIQLSEDAKPNDPYYRKGIEKLGGGVYFGRVNGVLAVARAVGDHSVGAINPRPKIIAYPIASISAPTYLILACDGIYDVASTRQIAAAVQEHTGLTTLELARDIVYSANRAGSRDNLSVLIIKIK